MSEEKLASLGITLPDAPVPQRKLYPSSKRQESTFISGQIPLQDGKVAYTGKVSDENLETAQKSARVCAINILAQIKENRKS